MIKISQMPIYSGALDSVYVPIIRPGGDEWANYRMLASELQGEEGGGTVEVENGLYKSAYDVVRLGGTLTEDTEIDVDGHSLSIAGLPENIVANVLYYDDVTGDISFGAIGAGAATTADNGLTMSTVTNVQLGSNTYPGEPLLHDTYIDADTFGLFLTGTGPNVIAGENTAAGIGVQGSSVNGIGVNAYSTNNTAIYARSYNFYAIQSAGFGGASHAAVIPNIIIGGYGSDGIGLDGIGASIDFEMSTSGTSQTSNRLISRWVDATHATRTAEWVVSGWENAVENELFKVHGNGDVEVLIQDAGIIIRSPDGTRYRLTPANGGGSSIWTAV